MNYFNVYWSFKTYGKKIAVFTTIAIWWANLQILKNIEFLQIEIFSPPYEKKKRSKET